MARGEIIGLPGDFGSCSSLEVGRFASISIDPFPSIYPPFTRGISHFSGFQRVGAFQTYRFALPPLTEALSGKADANVPLAATKQWVLRYGRNPALRSRAFKGS